MPVSPNFSETDLFAEAVSKFFGDNWWEILSASPAVKGPLIPLLAEINSVVFFGISAMCLIIFAMGSLNTANEGVMGGSKIQTFWWPLRAVFSMSMTFPVVKGGLSVFQVVLLIMVGYGGQMANELWTKGLGLMANSNFAVISAELPPHIEEEGRKAIKIAYDAAIAQKFYLKKQRDLEDSLRAQISDTSNPEVVAGLNYFKSAIYNGPGIIVDEFYDPKIHEHRPTIKESGWYLEYWAPTDQGLGINPGDFGSVFIPSPETDDPMMVAKRRAIVDAYKNVQPIAYKIVYNHKDINPNWHKNAFNAYMRQVANVYENFASIYPEDGQTQQVERFKQQAIKYGWASAGAYPILMSRMGEKARDRKMAMMKMAGINNVEAMRALDDNTYHQYKYTVDKGEAELEKHPSRESLKQHILKAAQSDSTENVIGEVLSEYMDSNPEWMINSLEETDPIIFFTVWGHKMVWGGVGMWTTGLGAAGLKGYVRGTNDSVWGAIAGTFSLSATEGASGAAIAMLDYIQWTISLVAGGVLLVGAFFAYVFPMIPTLYWIMAMTAYLFLVLEVACAAPFWAAAHALSTQEDGPAGELGKKGYYQFLEILIRPTLYMVGFFAVFIAMQASGWMTARILQLFSFAYDGANDASAFWTNGMITQLITALIFGAVYVFVFYWLCSEGFSNLPRNVINWIGGQGKTLGVGRAAEGMRAAIVGGVNFLGQGGGSQPSIAQDRSPDKNSGGGSGSDPNEPGEKAEGTGGSGIKKIK